MHASCAAFAPIPHMPIASHVGSSQSFVAGVQPDTSLGVHSGMPELLDVIIDEVVVIIIDVVDDDVDPPVDPPAPGRKSSKFWRQPTRATDEAATAQRTMEPRRMRGAKGHLQKKRASNGDADR